jgi:hypothetical protein
MAEENNLPEILNYKEFRGTRHSILAINKDNEWKGDLIQYINDETDVASKMYFYYMLPCVRFTKDPKYGIACTDRYKVIWLNAPNENVESIHDRWYFIYLHECLHQMWDTFGAEDEVKKQWGKCNHYLMNVAADCVINEYLHTQRDFKLPYATDGLITAKSLKENYGVDYNPREDTQVSLYKKLEEVADKIMKNKPDQKKNPLNQPKIDHKSDKYVEGWNKAMADWKAGKINKENIEEVYKKAMEKIQNAVQHGER